MADQKTTLPTYEMAYILKSGADDAELIGVLTELKVYGRVWRDVSLFPLHIQKSEKWATGAAIVFLFTRFLYCVTLVSNLLFRCSLTLSEKGFI